MPVSTTVPLFVATTPLFVPLMLPESVSVFPALTAAFSELFSVIGAAIVLELPVALVSVIAADVLLPVLSKMIAPLPEPVIV